uniref:phospholipase A2 inhibitor and Ly6/PLAUR domain-containing protein-like n=1 Tax=Podarcis muralis TaxID=64176 RepID=UPI00109F6E82|nr:phospholipase A2 inhibitor and Ly6/PLAUR domain-containing protein-like [Podarcis muralis]
MVKTLLISCLLLALLPPVASLICDTCWNRGDLCENPTDAFCNSYSNQSCMSALGESSIFGLKTPFVFKSCMNADICNGGYSSVSISSSLYAHSNILCYESDLCDRFEPPKMPVREKREPNGLKCPSCISLSSLDCVAENTVDCINEEDQCFYSAAYIDYVDDCQSRETHLMAAIRGCATSNTCDYVKGLREADLYYVGIMITEAECTKAMDDNANEL